MNRKIFFDHVRASLFGGALDQDQVDGLNFILSQWGETGFTDRRWLAYALATAAHETAWTIQPIREYKRGRGKKYGRKDPQTGQTYYGRGYVQLTWKYNYRTASQAMGIDFVNDPDLVMEPANAAFIMFQGMKDGWFTTKKFADYINEHECDYWNARRIINGTDRAGDIAGYAEDFEKAIEAAWEARTEPEPEPESSAPETFFELLVRFLRAVWKGN